MGMDSRSRQASDQLFDDIKQRNWQDATSWEVYRQLLNYTFGYWQRFSLAVVGMVGYAAADSGFMLLMRPLLDGSFVERDPETIRWIPIAILVLFLLRGSGAFITTYFMAGVAQRVVRTMRNQVFSHLMVMPTSYFESQSSGHLLAKLTFHVEQVAVAATNAITTLIRDGLTAIGLTCVMFYMSWRLSLFILVVGPLIALLVGYVSKRFRSYAERIQVAVGEVTSTASESINAQREIKIFGGQAQSISRFRGATANALVLNMKVALVQALNGPMIQFIGAWSVAGIIYFATQGEAAEQMTAGTFVAFLGATIGLLGPIKRLTNVNVELQRGIAAAGNIFNTLALSPEQDQGQRSLERAKGHIEVEDLHFAYEGAEQEALRGIDLEILPGQTVAFVGQSGSGKTTFVSLIPRFYDRCGGVIRLDGTDINEFRLAELRKNIALVGQHVTLFNGTIRDNIAYGALGEVSDEQVIAAAESANAWDFIQKLPDGLYTEVGENGVLLSGGQRQRLAIARALLKDAPILILDEATSALDTETERTIQNALDTLMKNRTTLVVAHRLSTIEKADRIVVMEAGKILESGSHAELLAADGHYARLYKLQFSDATKA